MARPPGHGPDFERRRQEIIDKAAVLFARNGYVATGTTELCREVGLGKGALYNYIGSKENLLLQIQDRVLQPLLAAAKTIAALDADPLFKLRLLSETLLESILGRLDHIWVYEHDYRHLTGQNRRLMVLRRAEFSGLVQQLIEDAIDEGAFRAVDPRLATLQFLNLHNHTYQWAHRVVGEWTAASLAREYCRTLFTGLCAENVDVQRLEMRVDEVRERHDPGSGSALGFLSLP